MSHLDTGHLNAAATDCMKQVKRQKTGSTVSIFFNLEVKTCAYCYENLSFCRVLFLNDNTKLKTL
jgi:hypothetical protein